MTKYDKNIDGLGRRRLTQAEREAIDHRAMAAGRGQFPDDEEIPPGSRGSREDPPAAVRAMMRDPSSVWVRESQTAAARQGFAVKVYVPPLRLSSLRAIGCAYNNPLLRLGLPVYPPGAWRVGRR